MSSYVVKERDWDTQSIRSGREPHQYTTVRRYRVPDREERVERIVEKVYDDDARTARTSRSSHRDDERDEIRITRTRGDDDARSVRTSRADETRDEIRITHTRDDDDARSVRTSRRDHDDDFVSYRYAERGRDRSRSSSVKRTEDKIVIRRDISRSPSPEPERVKEHRYERVYDRDDRYHPYDLERYSKSTEYFSRPEPIIIRESAPAPIIIREEAPKHEVIIRREERSPSPSPVREESVAVVQKTEETAVVPAPPPQEDYYYERVTREVDRPRRYYEDDHHHRRRRKSRDYNSDDDVRYVRREVHDYEVRDESPHTKRHLAEGAIVGLGAAALKRHHSKRNGEEPGHRGRQALAYATAGAIGAEALSRAKKRWDDRSRSGSPDYEEWYEDREGRRFGERRHRSRSRRRSSSNHGKRNTALAIAGVAAAAAAAYAAGKRGNNTTIIEDRRSRSRHRRSSVSGTSVRSDSRSLSDTAANPEHRNRTVAQAGLAGAALAGLAQHHRSKSRGKSQSKSRVRQGAPIAAAGLGSAAVAGLYEKFKARKERKRSESRARSRSISRSRSRSRSRSAGPYAAPRHASTQPALIKYGSDPIYTDDDHHRSASRSRRRSWSSSRSDRHRGHGSRSRSRSHSRFRDVAAGATAAGVTGLALNEAKKRREAKKAEKERKRREDEAAAAADNDNYYDPMQYYPATNSFPPPPGPSPYAQDPYSPPPLQGHPNEHYQDPGHAYGGQPAPYNPADYAPQTGPTMPDHYYSAQRDAHSPTQDYYRDGGRPPPGAGRHGGGPENVSAFEPEPAYPEHSRDLDDGLASPSNAGMPSGMSTPKSVKFDVPGSSAEQTPKREKDEDESLRFSSLGGESERNQPKQRDFAHGAGEAAPLRSQQSTPRPVHDYRGDSDRERDRGGDGRATRDRNRLQKSKQGATRRRADSPTSSDSGETVELPPRFDEQGRRRSEPGFGDDALAGLFRSIVEGVINGRGDRLGGRRRR